MSFTQFQPPLTPSCDALAAQTLRLPGVVAFYTRLMDKGDAVKLYVNSVTTRGRPDFDGFVGNQPVVVWIRRHQGKKFLSIYGRQKDDKGLLPSLGTAHLVVNNRGIPKIAIRMHAHQGNLRPVIWATASPTVDQRILVDAGLDLQVLAFRQQAAAEARVKKSNSNADLQAVKLN